MADALTVQEIARRASVGFVLLRGGVVDWVNTAARTLVEPYGGTWTGAEFPVGLLHEVQPGACRVMKRWSPEVGDPHWWRVTCTMLEPPVDGLLYEITDRSALSRAERPIDMAAPQWRLDRLEALAEMGSWIWDLVDDHLEWSSGALTMIGLPTDSPLDFADFRAMVHPDDLPAIDSALIEALSTGKPFDYTHRLRARDSSERIFECHGEVFHDRSGRPIRVMGTSRNVTEQHRARRELAYLAEHDPLTGIANRRRITAYLAECAAGPVGATLLMIDVDHFKDINDVRGHAVGDLVLRSVAGTIADRLGPDALLGRIGGDEFAVVLPRCDAEHGLALGEKLCGAVATVPVVEGSAAIRATVSIGVAEMAPAEDVEVSLARADLALYEAKNSGRNRARLFAPDQYRQAKARVGLLRRVGDALDADTMQLYAQPIVDLATGRAGRSELLIRLRDGLEPELGPAQFLPAAERTDLVLRLDRWVLERAVQALATAPARARDLHLEVNISARSVEDDDLGSWVLRQLSEHDVRPERLGLEMTETAAITNLDSARRLVGQLTGAGCGFSLDDFGAGFGSFSHLKHLPFTAVKIAGEFVRQLDIDRVDRALVGAVVEVARELRMRTVAEQVDRPELVHLLRELGVHDGQGFHLGRPRPLAELLR